MGPLGMDARLGKEYRNQKWHINITVSKNRLRAFVSVF